MFKQVSTKALYAKLQTFLPTITTWDVPFTAQEERARVEFMTEGEGFDTVQSVKASKRAIQWADDVPLMPSLAPRAPLEPPLAPRAPLEPSLALLAPLEPPLALLAPLKPVIASLELIPALTLDEPASLEASRAELDAAPCASLEAAPCTSLDPSACEPSAPETPFQVVMRVLSQAKPKRPLNPAGIRTVVVRNLPRDIKDTEIRALFSAHASGGLRDVYIPRNTDRSSQYFGTLKGFALVKFHTAEDSTQAYEALQSLCIRGKKVTLEFAKEDR